MRKDRKLQKLLQKTVFDYERVHNITKISNFQTELLDRKVNFVPSQYKAYARKKEILLPKPDLTNGLSLKKVLLNRSSAHNVRAKEIKLISLSSLLFYSGGIKRNSPIQKRFYPSAGACYPLEIYLILNRTEISQGIYHYYTKNHSLEKLWKIEKEEMNDIFSHDWVKNTGAVILITGIFERTTSRYGERGYRHVLIEVGCLMQNIYLMSEANGLSCNAVGGYIDESINKLLEIDGSSEAILAVITIN